MTGEGASRVVFFGTPDWAVPSLQALVHSELEVTAVVTNPDRPAGRGYELKPSPVKELAISLGLEILQPEKARDADFAGKMRALAPDVAVVVAYGKILPGQLLEIPRCGFVNMHFSLLPAYRGAAPVQRAIMDGVETTGTSIMVLTEGMDEGPVLASEDVAVGPTETAGELGARLAERGATLLAATIPEYLAGRVAPVPQNDADATYASKITAEEARIDWSAPSEAIINKARGLNPAPGAWTTVRGQRLKIFSLALSDENALGPGEVEVTDAGLLVGAGDRAVLLGELQLAGKKRTTGGELARGLRFETGERLGQDVGP